MNLHMCVHSQFYTVAETSQFALRGREGEGEAEQGWSSDKQGQQFYCDEHVDSSE